MVSETGGGGPDRHFIGGGYYYQPEGTVDLEPESLEEFADFLAGDLAAFRDARQQAIDEHFRVEDFPPFAGDVHAAGGMPEGMAFGEEYFGREMAVQMLLGDVEMGLLAMQLAARIIHADYLASDFLGGGTGSGDPFAGYGLVSETFTAGRLDHDGADPMADPEQLERLGIDSEAGQRFADAVAEQEQLAEQEFDAGTGGTLGHPGDRGYTGAVLNQGEAGEYPIGNDTRIYDGDQARHVVTTEAGEVRVATHFGPPGPPEWEHPIAGEEE
jgi:hypothetical protein